MAGALAQDDVTSSVSGVPTSDVRSLERNSYIIIGLLGGVILLLGVLGAFVVRLNRANKGYTPLVGGPFVPGSSMRERRYDEGGRD